MNPAKHSLIAIVVLICALSHPVRAQTLEVGDRVQFEFGDETVQGIITKADLARPKVKFEYRGESMELAVRRSKLKVSTPTEALKTTTDSEKRQNKTKTKPQTPAKIAKGDTVEFQWGPDQVRGTVTAIADSNLFVEFRYRDGDESTGVDRKHARLVTNPDEPLANPRIQAGDFVTFRGDGDRIQRAQVRSLDGPFVRLKVSDGLQSKTEIALLDDLSLWDSTSAVGKTTASSAKEDSATTAPNAIAAPEGVRTWVDRGGNHSIEAVLVNVTNGVAKLRRASDDKVVQLRIDRLSHRDQAYLAAKETRFVNFEPPKGLDPICAAVSRTEQSAVIGYGKGYNPPLSALVILDLTGKQPPKKLVVPDLDSGLIWSISDDGYKIVTEHSETLSFDEETRRAKTEWRLTIWTCLGTIARPLHAIKKSPESVLVEDAKWLSNERLFYGRSDGEVTLLNVDHIKDAVDVVQTKKVGRPSNMRTFGINHDATQYVVENSTKGWLAVFSTADARRKYKVPTNASVEAVTISDDLMLLGATSRGNTVAWDLRKDSLVGNSSNRANLPNGLNFSSFGLRLFPLNGTEGVVAHRSFRKYRAKAVVDFATGNAVAINAPEVFCIGSHRRIWYIADDRSGHYRFQAYSIPLDPVGVVNVAGYQK